MPRLRAAATRRHLAATLLLPHRRPAFALLLRCRRLACAHRPGSIDSKADILDSRLSALDSRLPTLDSRLSTLDS